MEDLQVAVLKNMVENARVERVFEVVTQIVESKGIEEQEKYRLIIEIIANDQELLSKISQPTAYRILTAASELGVLKQADD